MKKLLITGANGFLGSHLVEAGLVRGLEVYAGVRKTSDLTHLRDPRIHKFFVDFNHTDELKKELAKYQFEYIIHNAGITGGLTKEDLFKVNYGITKSFVDIVKESTPGLKKFLFMSSLAAYGPADNTDHSIVEESSEPQPVTRYGESKLAAEKYIMSQSGFPYIIFRPTAVFGPRDKEMLRVFRMVNMGIAAQIGLSKQTLSFIYVKDLAKLAIEAILSKQSSKAYFVSDGNVYSGKTFNKILAEALNKNIISLRIPIGLLKLVAACSEFYSKISRKSSVLNLDKVNELKARNWNCSIEHLKKDLDYKPAFTLREAAVETVKWYRENKWL